jgi:hypothetical protein
MTNTPQPNERNIHIMHDGKFYFSTLEGIHPSWCDLKILQGKAKTLILLSQPRDYVGKTYIVNAIKQLSTQILNIFGLDPATTIFLHYTPPTIPPPIELDKDDPLYPLARLSHTMSGPSDEKYERITFEWIPNSADVPMLTRYYVRDFYYQPIVPGEAAKLLEELNHQDEESESK